MLASEGFLGRQFINKLSLVIVEVNSIEGNFVNFTYLEGGYSGTEDQALIIAFRSNISPFVLQGDRGLVLRMSGDSGYSNFYLGSFYNQKTPRNTGFQYITTESEVYSYEKDITLEISGDYNINCDGTVIFNGGSNNGLVLLNQLTQKLNNLENEFNSILSTLKGITVTIPPGGGSVPFSPFFSSINPLTPTQSGDIENTKITQ